MSIRAALRTPGAGGPASRSRGRHATAAPSARDAAPDASPPSGEMSLASPVAVKSASRSPRTSKKSTGSDLIPHCSGSAGPAAIPAMTGTSCRVPFIDHENPAAFEQTHAWLLAPLVLAQGAYEAGPKRQPHLREILGDRVCQAERRRIGREQRLGRMVHEAVGDRFVISACDQDVIDTILIDPRLRARWHDDGRGLVYFRHPIEAVQACNLLDQGPPRSRCRIARPAVRRSRRPGHR